MTARDPEVTVVAPTTVAAVEHTVQLLRERLYGAISCLATLAVLSRYTHGGTDAWDRLLDVAVASGGLWAASLLADWVAHLAVHGQGPRGRKAVDILRGSRQILIAAAAPMLLLAAAGFGWLRTDVAVTFGEWVVVVELGLIALLAVRRSKLLWWQRLLTVFALAGLGTIVVAIKTLAH